MNCDGSLSYEQLVLFMESAPANIFFKDTECKYRFVSEICGLVNGGKENTILGKTDLEIHKNKKMGQEYYEDDRRILRTGKGSCCISEFSNDTGSIYLEIKKNPVYENRKIIGIVGVINDITKRIELEQELENLSFTDRLTGLYNRNYMETKSKKYICQENFPVSLIMMDCNYLKRTNDTLGHDFGDLLLQRISRTIKSKIPENCIAMRVGGDEFLILCPKCSAQKAQHLIFTLQEGFKMNSDDLIKLSTAFGVYTTENDSLSFEEVFHLADQNMYKNKKKGREV